MTGGSPVVAPDKPGIRAPLVLRIRNHDTALPHTPVTPFPSSPCSPFRVPSMAVEERRSANDGDGRNDPDARLTARRKSVGNKGASGMAADDSLSMLH